MSKLRLFGTSRPRLNVLPLLLTPGFAAVGYAAAGPRGAEWTICAWLAVVIGAAVSCTVHALRNAHEDDLRRGRRAFDYDANAPR